MQRGAASPSNSTTSNSPAAKRAKLNSGAAQATRVADQAAFQAVQAQEDAKREAILGKLAEEAGDTKWVLKAPSSARPSLNVVNAGYGTIDTARALPQGADEVVDEKQEEQPVRPQLLGRKSYGKFNKQIEVSLGRVFACIGLYAVANETTRRSNTIRIYRVHRTSKVTRTKTRRATVMTTQTRRSKMQIRGSTRDEPALLAWQTSCEQEKRQNEERQRARPRNRPIGVVVERSN